MPTLVDPELMEAAAQAARQGGEELARRFRGALQIAFKGGIDLVTDADRAAEEKVVGFLERRFPGHAILAEERGASQPQGGAAQVRWIVDPLDGTTNFAHRVPHFCVSVAAEDAEGLAAGALFDPLRGELFLAGRGRGASLNDEPLRTSSAAELGAALLSTGFPYDVWTAPELPIALLDAFVRRAQGLRRMGSAALDLAYVACGRYDGFFEVKLKPWDIAAGALLVSEAGGRATDFDGGQLALDQGDVLASNGLLHSAMVEVIRGVRSGASRGISNRSSLEGLRQL